MNAQRAINLSLVALLFVAVPEDNGCCFQENPVTGNAELVCGEDVLGPNFFPIGCSLGAAVSADAGAELNTQITIADLSSPAIPLASEADDDPKDVKRKRYRKFPGDQPKRLMLKAKHDDAAARLYYDFVFSGSFVAQLVVGIDDVANLTDGSTAYFEVAPAAGGAGPRVRMTVTWDAASGMLLVGARDESGPLGEAAPFPPSLEIFLGIYWNAFNGLSLTAYSNEGGYFEYVDWELFPPDDSIVGALGVENLGKKSRFYFSNLTINAPQMVIEAGVVRAALAGAGALKMCEEAWAMTNYGGGYPGSVSALIAKTTEALEIAQQELLDAVASGGSLGAAQVKLAFGSLKKGLKRAKSADKLAAKLIQKNKPTNKALDKRVNKTRWACRLFLAQLYGFKSKSIDKLFDTVIFEL